MQKGLLDLWDIVLEQNVTTVIALCNQMTPQVYKEQLECFRYIPGDFGDETKLRVGSGS